MLRFKISGRSIHTTHPCVRMRWNVFCIFIPKFENEIRSFLRSHMVNFIDWKIRFMRVLEFNFFVLFVEFSFCILVSNSKFLANKIYAPLMKECMSIVARIKEITDPSKKSSSTIAQGKSAQHRTRCRLIRKFDFYNYSLCNFFQS